ncbi:conserved hypothetical protein [Vibrio chagasii]|nr:conserved hypothetical protein [Vibrio chagasii]
MYLSILSLGGIGVALHFAEIEITSPANGFIDGDENNILIKSPMVGNVSEIFVSSGTQVDVGTPLIAFDNQDLIFRTKSLTDNKAALEKSIGDDDAEICLLSNLLSVLEHEDRALLKGAFTECGISREENPLAYGIAKSFEWKVVDYFEYKDSIDILIQSKAVEEAILDKSFSILEDKIVRLEQHNATRLQIDDTLRELNSLSQRKSEYQSEGTRMYIDVSNKKNIIYTEISTRLITTTENIVESRSDLSLTNYELQLSNLKIDRSTIHSPIDGVVLNLEENVGVDYWLDESESVMILKKNDADIIVNARFDTKYRSNIAIGMKVRVQPSLASSRNIFEGSIVHISEDSFEDETRDGDKRYYKVKIVPDSSELTLDEGTEVRVFAVGWTVSLLDYMKSVFFKNSVKFEPYN